MAYKDAQRQIVYLDESGFAHDMPGRVGYAPVGERCIGQHDWHARGRLNVIGAWLLSSLLTVCLFTGAINTKTFEAWVEQDWLPPLPPNSVVVMDNATFHKSFSIQQLFQPAGPVLEYLPTYSPDLNPIERKWAQAKAIRKQKNSSVEELFTRYIL